MPLAKILSSVKRVGIDWYTLALIGCVVLAAIMPARGAAAAALGTVTYWAVALLFFLYGAKLSTSTIAQGLINWPLQSLCLACTFLLFPVLTVSFSPLTASLLPAAVSIGFLYIGCLPSTVQSSIAFTSISRGNVAGAICAASLSNLLGVVLSPLLFSMVIASRSEFGIDSSAIWKICQQILLPFVAGQLCRPLLAGFLNRYRLPTMIVDRGSILLIVYAAFSAGRVNGVWDLISPAMLTIIVGFCAVLLTLVLVVSLGTGKMLRLPREDSLALVYVGSTKSMATGIPMAGILFGGQDISLIVIPIMVFHLMQLIVCAVVSQRVAHASAACA